jgi:hypothetical protein
VLDHLSTEACYARRGAGGRQLIEADGFIGAAFRHRTSRAGDPQLHTHVVVPNLVHADGRWSAPDGRHLFTWKMTGGNSLPIRIAGRAGASRPRLAGTAQRPERAARHPQAHPAGILEASGGHRTGDGAAGTSSRPRRVKAALATRERKPAGSIAEDVLRTAGPSSWLDDRIPMAKVAPALPRSTTSPPPWATKRPCRPDRRTPRHPRVLPARTACRWMTGISPTTTARTWSSRFQGLPLTLLGPRSPDERPSVAWPGHSTSPRTRHCPHAELLERDSVVRVLGGTDVGSDQIRTRSGQIVPATSGDRRYTTTELLAAEQRIVGSAVERIADRTAQVAPALVDQVLRRHPHLDGEQAVGVRALLTSGNGYDLVSVRPARGSRPCSPPPGSVGNRPGYRVIGTAVAARTAADLEAGTGIPSSSLTHLLADLREAGGLTSRHVIVVDEASMVGSRNPSTSSVRHADASGAKVVLVGDNRQLSSIDAGGALRTLSHELGADVITLTTNRRQAGADQAWEREALVSLRSGDVVPAVDAYVDHGRVTITGSIDEARQRLVEDWWAVHHDHTTAILAVRRVDVRALNDMVRGTERRTVSWARRSGPRRPRPSAWGTGSSSSRTSG